MGGQGRKTIIPLFSPKRYRERCGLPKPLPLGATATTAASGGNREELLGPRPAGCERQRSRRWEPQPGQWHCEAMTERASPARKSRRRSDRQALCQSDTIAAPVILGQQPCPLSRACARQLPQRESLCLRGLREFVENARLKRKEFVNVIKMRRRY